MATKRHILANRRNAARSTAPKHPKARPFAPSTPSLSLHRAANDATSGALHLGIRFDEEENDLLLPITVVEN